MPVIPIQGISLNEVSAVWLPEYARVIGISECALLGVMQAGQVAYACGEVWTWSERRLLVDALAEAESEIEAELRFGLSPQWYSEIGPYTWPYLTKWRKVIAGGVKGVTTIAAGRALNHATDPATIVPVATTVTDVNEIRVFHPGTDIEIIPSMIVIAGGTVNLEIPRCRTLLSAQQNVTGGADYTVLANFETTVDIRRVYNDISTNAILKYPHQCSDSTCGCSCGCSEAQKTACIYVKYGEQGIVDITPASHAAGVWTGSTSCMCGAPTNVEVNYYAGFQLDTSDPKSVRDWTRLREATIRLAHSKMPQQPCARCDIATNYWTRDRNVPTIISGLREKCPFGISDGSWWSFRQVVSQRKMRLAVLGA
jgi:hypothetical protein